MCLRGAAESSKVVCLDMYMCAFVYTGGLRGHVSAKSCAAVMYPCPLFSLVSVFKCAVPYEYFSQSKK